jgi:hypothetical protein
MRKAPRAPPGRRRGIRLLTRGASWGDSIQPAGSDKPRSLPPRRGGPEWILNYQPANRPSILQILRVKPRAARWCRETPQRSFASSRPKRRPARTYSSRAINAWKSSRLPMVFRIATSRSCSTSTSNSSPGCSPIRAHTSEGIGSSRLLVRVTDMAGRYFKWPETQAALGPGRGSDSEPADSSLQNSVPEPYSKWVFPWRLGVRSGVLPPARRRNSSKTSSSPSTFI